MNFAELKPEQLRNKCDLGKVIFKTTAELEPLKGIIGQERADEAIRFGLKTKNKGYNIYVSGMSGTGRNSYINFIARKTALAESAAKDWIYVYNFMRPENPLAIGLKKGQGKVFKKAIESTIGFIKNEIEKTFTSKEYERARNMFLREYNESVSRHMNELNELAEKYGFIYSRNESGFVSIPLKNAVPMSEDDYRSLSKGEYEEIQKKSADLNMASIDIFKSIRDSEEEFGDRLRKLDRDFALRTVSVFTDRLEQRFEGNGKLKKYINMLKHDIIENVEMFKHTEDNLPNNPLFLLQNKSYEFFFKRYEVNLFIDNSDNNSAPVITETNPTYSNLLGHVEFENQMGVLQTGVDKIIPGSIHRANGGYLILQAADVLQNIFAWKGLLRSLLNEEINIETMENALGFMMTSGLKPEPIPLSLKVIIVGDPYTYSVLYQYDELFVKLFKIRADFDVEMRRNEKNLMKMAQFISAQCEDEKLNHLSIDAVCRVVEYSSRIADSKEKLSSRFNKIVEMLYEADVWSKKENEEIIYSRHIEKAIKEMIFRNNMYQEKILEYFEDDTYILDVKGFRVGEINGLAVVSTGQYSFGKPSKITVSTYNGKAGLINIEREARTSGKIHDKGVMIINGYLGYKYAQKRPLALSASIVFEQLYSGIDGDSASSTELYAILSSLSEIPINQGIAVTGSVNQRGLIQPIGGVNEKIEGYYEVCRIKGITGEQGVIIPYQNVKNLMLSQEVVDAVTDGKFHIYPIKTIDEGIEILTGVAAGEKDEKGCYPENTIHYLVNKKLKFFTKEDDDEKKEEKK